MTKADIQFYAGLVIALGGLVTVFYLKEPYIGFGVALLGTGIIQPDKVVEFLKR